jgi:ABC-type multidrug transport system fused ATPase/permease subunit
MVGLGSSLHSGWFWCLVFLLTLLFRLGVTTSFVYNYIGPHLCHDRVKDDSFKQMTGHTQSLSLRRSLEMRNNSGAAATASPVFEPSCFVPVACGRESRIIVMQLRHSADNPSELQLHPEYFSPLVFLSSLPSTTQCHDAAPHVSNRSFTTLPPSGPLSSRAISVNSNHHFLIRSYRCPEHAHSASCMTLRTSQCVQY